MQEQTHIRNDDSNGPMRDLEVHSPSETFRAQAHARAKWLQGSVLERQTVAGGKVRTKRVSYELREPAARALYEMLKEVFEPSV